MVVVVSGVGVGFGEGESGATGAEEEIILGLKIFGGEGRLAWLR